jgi:hypothetical protein
MEDPLKEKAFIERYGRVETMRMERRKELREARMLEAIRGFAAPYPFLVPGLGKPEGDP